MKAWDVLVENTKQLLHKVILFEDLDISLELWEAGANLTHCIPYFFVASNIGLSRLCKHKSEEVNIMVLGGRGKEFAPRGLEHIVDWVVIERQCGYGGKAETSNSYLSAQRIRNPLEVKHS